MRIVTGFHPIEEELKAFSENSESVKESGIRILYTKTGPRIKKILALAESLSIPCEKSSEEVLGNYVATLPEAARDHRGLLLLTEKTNSLKVHSIEAVLEKLEKKNNALVLVLDSITDMQNIGAIIRSAEQFGVDLVVIPDHHGAADMDLISRMSAGAAAWIPVVAVPNLVRAVELLKKAGFWVYGADSNGTPAPELKITGKTTLIMGNEGKGISRLLLETCDVVVSIPTSGHLDSLNVSVATGILLYEIRRSSK